MNGGEVIWAMPERKQFFFPVRCSLIFRIVHGLKSFVEGKQHGSAKHNQNTIGAGGVNPLQNLRQSFKCLICSWLFQLLQAVILGVEWSNAGPRRNPTNLACYSTHNHHLSSSLSSSSSSSLGTCWPSAGSA